MNSRSSALRKPTSPRKPKPAARTKLPEWNLSDLYAGIDAPEIARDLARMDAECVAFETDYKGRLAERTAKQDGGSWLAEAVRRYEAIDDLAGRLGSYAGLVHAGDSVDPAISKFYGDVSERLTAASLHLLFFPLELNRVDDATIEPRDADARARHYRPWIEDLRKDKPYQLEDRVEQLFHEKSKSGCSAWNRLFDETISSLRFRVAGRELAIEPTLSLLQDRAGEKRKAAAQALARTFKAMSGHSALVDEHARQGQGDLGPLARVRGRRGFAPSRQPRRARGRRRARRCGRAPPIRACRIATTGSRRAGSERRSSRIGTATRRCRCGDRTHRLGGGAGDGADGLSRLLAEDGRHRRALLRRALDRCAGAAREGAGRVRASDHALGASLCADQLPGQAARRDDARPRTRPWRAPGAGAAATAR